jgi:acyl-CoA synthetase
MSAQIHTDPALERDYINRSWWQTATLRERVRGWARTKADADAYIWDDSRLSWSSYDALVSALSARLAGLGLVRGDRVLVFLPDGAAVHAAYLACEAAGLIAVGVGWRAGKQELDHLVRRTSARAAICANDTRLGAGATLLDEIGVPARIFVEDLGGAPRPDDGPVSDVTLEPIGPSELWLLNSTSGTTGLPKCVMQTQNRWIYFHTLAMRFGQLDPDEVWMSVVPAPFGFGLWTAHVSPTVEGSPCVVQSRFDPQTAIKMIERERVTVLCAVSSQLAMLAEAAGDHDLSSLKVTFTGGEAISPSRAAAFEELTGCTILNFYGSNETGVLSGTKVEDPADRRLTTAGRCIPEMDVRLYGPDRERIPGDSGKGQPGCRGPALALGYWDDDDANSELFTADGWMLMGDIVTIDDEGWLAVVGRTSEFIIRGGKNISAPAVEEEVSTHPSVALCGVVAVPSARLGEQVAAMVELHDGAELDLGGLTAHFDARGVTREWWPEYLFVMDELPRSSGGKLAKTELRELAASLVAANTEGK